MSEHAGFQHPLMGASMVHLCRLLSERSVAPRHFGLVAGMLGSALARAPIALLERAFAARRIEQAELHDPVFIVGHWRSGTTHLHNVLGKAPIFGHISPLASGLPDELLTLATWLRPWLERALPEDRHVDRVAVTPDSPQEDEIPLANQQGLSVFHATYFPARFRHELNRGVFLDGASPSEVESWKRAHVRLLRKVAFHQGKPLLLIKNPVYTGRIRLLTTLWPRARFVHIYRNPYEVYPSTLRYHRKLLSEYALQDAAVPDLEDVVLQTYARLMGAFDREAEGLSKGQLIQVRFEDFERSPLEHARQIFEELALEGWEDAEAPIRGYLSTIRGYQKNDLVIDEGVKRAVDAHWGSYVDRWGYAPA